MSEYKKIAVFADYHLRTLRRHDEYNEVNQKFLSELRTYSPDLIVFTGDLLHLKNQTSNEMFLFLNDFLKKLREIAPLRLLIGNHDFVQRNKDRNNPVRTILQLMNDNEIVLFDNSGIFVDKNINFCVWGLMDDNKKPNIKEFKENNPDNKGIYVGLFHGPVKNVKTDIGFTFTSAYDVDNFSECDVVFLGDIHKRQILTTSNGIKCYMIGSTICQDKGESIFNHGFMKFNLDTMEEEFVDIHNDNTIFNIHIENFSDIFEGNFKIKNA